MTAKAVFCFSTKITRQDKLQQASSFSNGAAMLKILVRALPAPTWIGLIFSLISILIGAIFSVNASIVFLIIVAIAWFALYKSEYKLPASNHLLVVFCVLLGHIPYLIVHYLF